MALLVCFSKLFPHQRICLTLPAVSDNTSAEAGVNNLFTTKLPLALFLERLAFLSSLIGADLDTSHIAGASNEDADLLSRWNFKDPLPDRFTPENRIRLSLTDLWRETPTMSFHPESISLPWTSLSR